MLLAMPIGAWAQFDVYTDASMDSAWQITPMNMVNAGDTIAVSYSGSRHVKSVTYIKKLRTPDVTPPTAIPGVIYDGNAHTLINAGTTTGGTMLYQLNGGEWSTDLPAATEGGTYTVYYKVQGDDIYSGVAPTSITASILPATPAAIALSATSISFGADDFTTTLTVTRDGEGVVSATSDHPGELALSAEGNILTVRRIAGRPITGSETIMITVSVAATANYQAPAPVTCSYTQTALRTPETIESKDLGSYLGQYGYLWPAAYAAGCNEPLRAVVAYVGSKPNYFDKCLCVALEDLSADKLSNAAAHDVLNTWGISHDVNVYGTVYNSDNGGVYDAIDISTSYSPRTSATKRGWRLPTVCDIRYLMYAYNGTSLSNPDRIGHGTACGDFPALVTAINAACGNTNMQSGENYATGSHTAAHNNAGTWNIYPAASVFYWANDADGYTYLYRPVFAY